MKDKEQLLDPFLLFHSLQSSPASTPNAPHNLGTPLRLLVPPCGQATRPQSRCPRTPQPPPGQRCSAGPSLCPAGRSCPRVPKTLLVPFARLPCSVGRGGPGRSSQAFPPEGAQMSPNPPGHGRPSSWRWGAGLWVATWGLSPLCHPSVGFCHQKKTLPAAPWPGRKPMCAPHLVPGASPNFLAGFWVSPNPNLHPAAVRKEQLPSRHPVKDVLGFN